MTSQESQIFTARAVVQSVPHPTRRELTLSRYAAGTQASLTVHEDLGHNNYSLEHVTVYARVGVGLNSVGNKLMLIPFTTLAL